MSVTSEGESLASYEDTIKIIMLTEATFDLKLVGAQIICRTKDTTKQLPSLF